MMLPEPLEVLATGHRPGWTVVVLALAVAGCGASTEPRGATTPGPGFPQPDRTVCGWEEVAGDGGRLHVAAEGQAAAPAPAGPVLVLSAAPGAPFGAVRQALEPLADDLVRLKVVVDERWLIPVTFPYRRPTTLPKPDQPAVRTVGHRRITRSVGAPAERFADVRLAGDRVQLYVEHGGQPLSLPVGELAAHLRSIEPPVGTFALRVSDETPFAHVRTVLVAAACYDREPGDEAHEVILD